jgi:hypothetical protein
LRSSMSAQRSSAAHEAPWCSSGGTALGEHLCEATRVALGEHLREEHPVSMAACSANTPYSTPCERPAAGEHPLPGEHE